MELQVRAGVSRRVVRLASVVPWSILLLVACGTGPLDAPLGEGRVVFFSEGFEDDDFAARGWYDNVSLVTTEAEAFEGERSLEARFPEGATTAVWGSAARHEFPATDSVHVSYRVKYSANWQGSGRLYHPHEFQILTNRDERYTGPATTHLTAYIETSVREGALHPVLGLGDRLNVDTSNIRVDLTGVTEARAVAGCNGETDGHRTGCYEVGGGVWGNEKKWVIDGADGGADGASIARGEWHHVEVFFRMNSVVDGVGVADGAVRYRLDGELVLDLDDVLFRTGENSDMAFNQFLIAPYIGDGSPVDQAFWVDDLVVADGR